MEADQSGASAARLAMMADLRCLCGDTDCPPCGTAQGAYVDPRAAEHQAAERRGDLLALPVADILLAAAVATEDRWDAIGRGDLVGRPGEREVLDRFADDIRLIASVAAMYEAASRFIQSAERANELARNLAMGDAVTTRLALAAIERRVSQFGLRVDDAEACAAAVANAWRKHS